MDKHTNTPKMSLGGDGKGTDNNLSQNEQSILGILKAGGAFPAKELGRRTLDRDPRSTIRYLRKRNIAILDTWMNEGKTRYKLYFLASTTASSQLQLFPGQ